MARMLTFIAMCVMFPGCADRHSIRLASGNDSEAATKPAVPNLPAVDIAAGKNTQAYAQAKAAAEGYLRSKTATTYFFVDSARTPDGWRFYFDSSPSGPGSDVD